MQYARGSFTLDVNVANLKNWAYCVAPNLLTLTFPF